jgi:hypothetical protein
MKINDILYMENEHPEKQIVLVLKTNNQKHTIAEINKFILDNNVGSVSGYE